MMRMTDSLTAVELPEGGALCAVSGGLDSMCLLEMTVRQGQKQGRRVAAAHFNHQLRGAEADRDEAFVRDWCAAREIPFFAGRGDVRAFAEETGRTVEEAARQLRYKFLEETRRREGFGCILTAHHADDSAETMLLNLLRGTGLKGLTGIPEKRDCILRPLLSVTRAELAAYAAEHRIPFVEDSTNGTDDAARNMLRHQVLPVLKKLNPRVVENMSRTASLLAADEAALDAACRKLLAQCAVPPNVSGTVPLAMLQDAPEALRGRLVLAVLAAVAGHEKDLTAAHIRAVLTLDRGQLSMPYGVTVLREPAALRFFKAASAPAVQAVSVGETVTFGQWQVSLAESAGEGVLISISETADLTVTAWDSKDRLNGRTVKRLCGERGISPQERDRLPVLRVNGIAGNLWQQHITSVTALPPDAAVTTEPLPLPELLLPALPRRHGISRRKVFWGYAGLLGGIFLALAMLASWMNNQRLIRNVGDHLALYHQLSGKPVEPKLHAQQRLRADGALLDDWLRRGEPLRYRLGLYQGLRLVPLVEAALSDWAPPPPPPPVIKKIIQGPKTIRLDSMSLFDSGKSVLKAGSTRMLVNSLVGIKAKPGWLIVVSGHTDNTGNPQLNQTLSLKRA